MSVLLREEEEEGAQLGPTREIAAALSRRRWTQRRPSVAELRQVCRNPAAVHPTDVLCLSY